MSVLNMKDHMPFQHDTLNVASEAIGLTVYVNLAQAVQAIGCVIQRGEGIKAGDLQHIQETMTAALKWMDGVGFVERHPDLGDMPDKVEPLDFQGGAEGLTQWFEHKVELLMEGESSKILNHLN